MCCLRKETIVKPLCHHLGQQGFHSFVRRTNLVHTPPIGLFLIFDIVSLVKNNILLQYGMQKSCYILK